MMREREREIWILNSGKLVYTGKEKKAKKDEEETRDEFKLNTMSNCRSIYSSERDIFLPGMRVSLCCLLDLLNL